MFFKKKQNKYKLGDQLYCYYPEFGIVSFFVHEILIDTSITKHGIINKVSYKGETAGCNYYGVFGEDECGLSEDELTGKLIKKGYKIDLEAACKAT